MSDRDLDGARAELGVGPGASWEEVRAAYRRLIRTVHPDVAGPDAGDRAARVTAAFRALAAARAAPTAPSRTSGGPPSAARTAPPRPSRAPRPAAPPTVASEDDEDDEDGEAFVVALPLHVAFPAVVEACHHFGPVTYVDRSCAILETLVQLPGEGTCSFLVTLEDRGAATEVRGALEAIEHVASPPAGPIVDALRAALAGQTVSMADDTDRGNLPTDDELRERLTPLQYDVTQQGGTERAFTGAYWSTKDPGLYRCIVCDAPLFRSETKYDSGTGWPSFTEPDAADAVELVPDHSHGTVRTEVRCRGCGAHLGHVFDDGPAPSGQRYCMNSASLRLQPTTE